MANELNSYELSRNWFNWCFENPEKISPNHTALYFFCIEHCNRLGWKSKFGLPTTMAKDAIGIRSYNTYSKTLFDLVEWGFILMIEKSKNQYSSNIIALSKNNKALNKALDKAFIKHVTKQSESTIQSTGESIDSINKQETNKQETNKQVYRAFAHLKLYIEDFEKLIELGYSKIEIDLILDKIENYKKNTTYKSLYLTSKNWLEKEKTFKRQPEQKQSLLTPIIESRNKAHELIDLKYGKSDSNNQ